MLLWSFPVIVVGIILLFLTGLALGELDSDSNLAEITLLIYLCLVYLGVFVFALFADLPLLLILAILIFNTIIVFSSANLGRKLRELKELKAKKK